MDDRDYQELLALEQEAHKRILRSDAPKALDAYSTLRMELWEKYAPEAWRRKLEPTLDSFHVWTIRPPDEAQPRRKGMVLLHPPLSTNAWELRWLLRNIPTMETLLALAREGYRRYRAALASDCMEAIEADAGISPYAKQPVLLIKLKFHTQQHPTEVPALWRWGDDRGMRFFRNRLYGWLHAAVKRSQWEGRERGFHMGKFLVELEENGVLDPMEPLLDLEHRLGIHVVSTTRCTRPSGRGWTPDLPPHLRGGDRENRVSAAAVTLHVPYDHLGHSER